MEYWNFSDINKIINIGGHTIGLPIVFSDSDESEREISKGYLVYASYDKFASEVGGQFKNTSWMPILIEMPSK